MSERTENWQGTKLWLLSRETFSCHSYLYAGNKDGEQRSPWGFSLFFLRMKNDSGIEFWSAFWCLNA